MGDKKHVIKRIEDAMTERQIELLILQWLNSLADCFAVKNENVGIFDTKRKAFRRSAHPFRPKGVSDIIGLYKGRYFAIEVKSKKGALRDEQKDFLEKVRKNGGVAVLARSLDDVRSAFTENFHQAF